MTAHHETRELLLTTRDELTQVKFDNLGWQAELHTLQAGLVRFQGNLEGMHHDLEALRHERNALHSERDTLRAERDALHGERNTLYSERDTLLHERDALLSSLSWKVTAPLRGLFELATSPASSVMGLVLKYPELSKQINTWVMRFPGLHKRLRGAAIAQGMMHEPVATPPPATAPSSALSLADLSPCAQTIHAALLREQSRLKE